MFTTLVSGLFTSISPNSIESGETINNTGVLVSPPSSSPPPAPSGAITSALG